MEILAYGEDALTLWALKHKLNYILQKLNDSSNLSKCQAFYRPSFGRRGGKNSSQFGEFDLILLTRNCIYLGESKWENSSEKIVDGKIELREEQILRHKLFRFYITEWAFGSYENNEWKRFSREARPKLIQEGIEKPIAPENSLLAENLRTILKSIKEKYSQQPPIKDILLYFHKTNNQNLQSVGDGFKLVKIDYSEERTDNYIKL